MGPEKKPWKVFLETTIRRLEVSAWRKKYRVGQVVTQFIARDIRREVEVVDVSEIENGLISGRTKTWNVLYAIRGIQKEPQFGEIRQLEIKRLWCWKGESWGGPVPKSIDHDTI